MGESNKPENKDNLKRFIKDNYADLIGSGISGTLSLFSTVNPYVGFLSGPAGAIIAGILKSIGKDVNERQLSPREDFRVGKVLAIAALEIHQRLEKGESLRDDGFFDRQPSGRSDAEEITESIMLKCQREPQEKKIEYIGYLLSGIAFDSNLSPDMGHQLIKASEELTYRQLCILKLVVAKAHYGLRNQNYRDHGNFARNLYSVLYECMYLYQKEYITEGDSSHALGLTDIVPSNITVQGIGSDLYNLMKLSSIPDEDIIPIVEVLK